VNFGRGASKKKLSILARGRKKFSLSFSKKKLLFPFEPQSSQKMAFIS
jgi:hypothetical protein